MASPIGRWLRNLLGESDAEPSPAPADDPEPEPEPHAGPADHPQIREGLKGFNRFQDPPEELVSWFVHRLNVSTGRPPTSEDQGWRMRARRSTGSARSCSTPSRPSPIFIVRRTR